MARQEEQTRRLMAEVAGKGLQGSADLWPRIQAEAAARRPARRRRAVYGLATALAGVLVIGAALVLWKPSPGSPVPTQQAPQSGPAVMIAEGAESAPRPPEQAGTLPAPAGEEPRVLSPEESMRRDAQEYAVSQGISLDEAIRRLELQDEIGRLNAKLEANERDTFAGLWIQHQPEYRVVVRFIRDGEETIRRYVEGGPLADIVEVLPAEFTLDELLALQDEFTEIAIQADVLAWSGVNVQEHTVELAVTDRAKLEATLQEMGRTLPANVTVSEVTDLPTPLIAE